MLLCSASGQNRFTLFGDLMIFTCVSHSEQVAVGGLGLVDHRDVNNGCEDGTIKRPEREESFRKTSCRRMVAIIK